MMRKAMRRRLFTMRRRCNRGENVNLTQSLSHEKRYKGFDVFVWGDWDGGLLRVCPGGWDVWVSREWGAGPGGV